VELQAETDELRTAVAAVETKLKQQDNNCKTYVADHEALVAVIAGALKTPCRQVKAGAVSSKRRPLNTHRRHEG